MSLETASWEHALELRAYHALNNQSFLSPILFEQSLLQKAYRHCVDLTRHHSKTFYMASKLLPAEQRAAARALYAFCRVSDDLIDDGGKNRLRKLAVWKTESLSHTPNQENLVAVAWADARAKFTIPTQYAEQLLDGVAIDLTKNRFANFQELANYCYGVASTVGLMTMHIVGYRSEVAIPYAIKLGVALQLTNILRDVGEDWANGRLYLPQDELAAFNLTEQDINDGVISDNWRRFMQFQLYRTRALYQEAMCGIEMLGKDGRFAIAAAAELYRGILEDIENNDYNVFTRRAHLTKWQKTRRLPSIWYRARTNRYSKMAHNLPAQTNLSGINWR